MTLATPDPAAVRDAILQEFRHAVAPIFLGIGLLYLAMSTSVFFLLEGTARWTMLAVAAGTSLVIVALGLGYRRTGLPVRSAVPITAAAAIALISLSVFYSFMANDASDPMSIIWIMVGAALLLPSMRAVATIAITASVAWAVVVATTGGHWELAMSVAGASPLVFLVAFVRQRTWWRLHETRLAREMRDEFAQGAEELAMKQQEELEKLRELDRVRTRLLNTAAHELNTPLTPLRLQLHMLKGGRLGELGERQARSVDVLDRNVKRLSTLAQDILDVARLDSGNLKVHAKPTTVARLIQHTADSFEEAAHECGVSLTWDVEDDLHIHADPARVEQILFNLVGNALKFTPSGGFVHIIAKRDAGQVRFDVTDSGVGLTAAQMDRLFQPFTQVQEPDVQGPGGTGLGLYISRGLVEAHGGKMTVTSEGPDSGSTFRFHLPWTDEAIADEGTAAPMVPRPITAPVAPRERNDALAQRLRELI